MGKKKVNLLPALFFSKKRAETGTRPWQWASCRHPKTPSFRAGDVENGNGMFKTVNLDFLDPSMGRFGFDHSPDQASWSTSTSESASHSTESENPVDDESLEVLIRSARSDRLFFEPGGDTSSILGPGSVALLPPFKESVVLVMESKNPYMDFRRSMEEMVESSGVKDWECLEELLAWYLRMNGRKNHVYIVEAFIDLLLNLSCSSSSNKDECEDFSKNTDGTSFSSAASSFSDDSNLSSKGEDATHLDEDRKRE